MDHIKRVVPNIQWQKEIKGKWPEHCFILPRLENEVIAEWFEELEKQTCEIVVMLLPTWPNQFWFKSISHTSFGFMLAGEIRFEGENVPFPGGLTLAVFKNALPLANYMLSIPRNPDGLGDNDVGFDASVFGGTVAGKSMGIMEAGSIKNIVTPVDALIKADREHYKSQHSIDSAKESFGTFKYQEQRTKDRLWEKRNPEEAALQVFKRRIDDMKDMLGRIDQAYDEHIEAAVQGDTEWGRDEASSVIERSDWFTDEVAKLKGDLEDTRSKFGTKNKFRPRVVAMIDNVPDLLVWRDEMVAKANELLAVLDRIDAMKKKHAEEMKAAVSGAVSVSGVVKASGGVSIGKQPAISTKGKKSGNAKKVLHEDDLVDKTDDEKWEVFDKFMASYETMKACGEITAESCRQYRTRSRTLMKKHGLDWKTR
jgi:hypothetical protein